MSITKQFGKYVSQNILGMIGLSAYILADTYFISVAEGANGITALNLVLPIYSMIFAIGSMIAVGSATRFKIARAKGEKKAEYYLSNAIMWAFLFSIIFMVGGLFVPERIVSLMGGKGEIISVATPYTRIFMSFAPCFMLNHIFSAFVRNDDAPSIAMIATFSSSIFNVVMDYVLMFPCKMGMPGAALATACSPLVVITICLIHVFSKKSTLHFYWRIPSLNMLIESMSLGIAAFVGEIASGVTTMVFNFLILNISGNVGIAAYGIVANVAIVAVSIFNGIAQGGQPLFSKAYGANKKEDMKKLLKLSMTTAIIFAILIMVVVNLLSNPLILAFNHEQNVEMAKYAKQGIAIYFAGFLFAGVNIVGTGYLSSTAQAKGAFTVSILRGVVAIVICAVLLSWLLGMTGVWLAFPVAEAITTLILIALLLKAHKKKSS